MAQSIDCTEPWQRMGQHARKTTAASNSQRHLVDLLRAAGSAAPDAGLGTGSVELIYQCECLVL